MAKDYGTGVSRTLQVAKTQFSTVVFQKGKPPMDAEFSLSEDVAEAYSRTIVATGMPSGWLGDGLNDQEAYLTNPTWSNWFRYGQQKTGELASVQWAAVNGWLIPVTGTLTGTPPGAPDDVSTWNKITLSPPPANSGDARIDFVFLEVWQALIAPNPSTTNKPSASGIWRYGNVEGGYTFLADDIIDPALGFETSKRVQTQYRIRVVSGLTGLTSYPDGFDPAVVKGRGAAGSDTAYAFTNMRQALGDPGLWRAGDGTANALGTVDGYTYAIPLTAVFRRNVVAWDGDPGQNLNGGFNRNPTAIDRTGVKTFSTVPTLSADMTASQLTLSLVSAANIPLPLTPASAVTIRVGDEYIQYTIITGTTMTISARGALGSRAEAHKAGTEVQIVSGRPDGLFSDQIAKTDIYDLRHVVNPNGYDYNALLRSALDKTLRGTLKANWKRSGGGPQGTFVAYQDKVSASVAALGVSKLDSPDNARQIWSDASVLQPIEFLATPPTGGPGPAVDISTPSWDLALTGTVNTIGGAGAWLGGDVITIPISNFQTTLPGSDIDQVQFPNIDAGTYPVVTLRLANQPTDLIVNVDYTVNIPVSPTDDLAITLLIGAAANVALFITFHVQYGAGRGMSRRPDSVHSVAYLNSSTGTILRQRGLPVGNVPVSTAWAPLWSKFRKAPFRGMIPITAESYADPGSKTLVLTPFRQIALPASTTFFRAFKDNSIHSSNGLMPNPSSKWGATTDPLGLFSGNSDGSAPRKNTYTIIPRKLMPGWGAVHAPIRHMTQGDIYEGINFGINSPEGTFAGVAQNNLIPYTGGSQSYATFTTTVVSTAGLANTGLAYNTALLETGINYAGIRFFTDSRNLGRQGLELPPFYGIARLFAVYEAEDFKTNGSAYNATTRAPAAGTNATNLLRQDFDGPTFWIEIDEDGDSTFILNADVLDLSKSPNAIASFATGHYVIEASIFGFDRGAFDLDDACRLVLSRIRPDANAPTGPNWATFNTTDVKLVIPAPPQSTDEIVANFSREPYQGDAWGSQSVQTDIGQVVGPRTSSDAYQLNTTELDLEDLSLPNPKPLEVMASTGFLTTLGTGRISGDFEYGSPTGYLDFRNPGYENAATTYPPANPIDPRPVYQTGAGLDSGRVPLGTEYNGCTTRLPLGAFFRDKDFRGSPVSDAPEALVPLLYSDDRSPGLEVVGVPSDRGLEQTEVPVFCSATASGYGGESVVHVDGETTNLALLTNYRTSRGGSVYTTRPVPGGEVASIFPFQLGYGSDANSHLVCIAYLVRNTVTSISPTERSAGQELMMLIVTSVVRRNPSIIQALKVLCGSNGSGEGFSAADLYRLPGHPLVSDGTRVSVDTAVQFTQPVSLKT